MLKEYGELAQKVTELNIMKNRLLADNNNLVHENRELRKEVRWRNDRIRDISRLLSDKKIPEVYAENKKLRHEIAHVKMTREWEQLMPGKVEEETWQLAYGDMVTLLLVFFVFIFAFSNVNSAKFHQAAGSLTGAFNPGMIETGQKPETAGKEGEGKDFLAKMKAEMEDLIRKEKLHENVDIMWKSGELIIAVKSRIFFHSGKADLVEAAMPILREMARLLEGAPKIVVEGHTDDIPINTPDFPSNWELSTARACRVLRFFVEEGNIAPEKLAAVGYAQYRPLMPNTSEENRASNRRVEIKIRHPK